MYICVQSPPTEDETLGQGRVMKCPLVGELQAAIIANPKRGGGQFGITIFLEC